MEKFYHLDEKEVYEALHTTKAGLKQEEAEKRQREYGKNELLEGKKKRILFLFLEQFQDFLVLLLLAAAGISFFLGDKESAAVIFAVLTLNAVLGTVQQKKAEQSLKGLKKLSSPQAKVFRDGERISVPSWEVTIGDIVMIEAGDFICADGRIIENHSLKVNESPLTGESESVEKMTQPLLGELSVGERKNMVFSGCFVTYGRALFAVTNIGMETEMGKVASLLKNTPNKRTPLQENLDDFGKKLSFVILGVCVVIFALSLWRGEDVFQAFLFAVALAVAAIPEALSSIVTVVLSFGTQKMAKEKAVVRKLPAVESLGSVSVICSDKTGTLTQNKMTVQKYAVSFEIIEEENMNLEEALERKLILFGALCNDSSNENGEEIGDPTEIAFINFGDKHGFEDTKMKKLYPRVGEIPFDSDRKLMTTIHQVENNTVMITKGAFDVLLKRSILIETKEGIHEITKEEKRRLEDINQTFSRQGLRVLAFAYKKWETDRAVTLKDEEGYTFLGFIAMMDPPREESKEAVKSCIEAGIKPVMITGDHKITAAAIARKIGILKEDTEAVEGAEIEKMSDEKLEEFVEHVSVYARVSPEHKIRIVKAWQNRGNIVAMTGDGVNDAPALKAADIGIAMGITGSEAAKDAAGVILTDDNFATIVKAVENGRVLFINIKNAIQFLLSGNTAGILMVLFASIFALPLPFAPVHLLFINLLTDSLPALALGLEPQNRPVMKEKPRKKGEPVLTKEFAGTVFLEGGILFISTAVSFMLGLRFGWDKTAQTMAFATLCLSRLIHGLNCKSKKPVLFQKALWNNPYLWLAEAAGVLLLTGVLFLPVLHGIFLVVPLSGKQAGIAYGFGILPFFVIQALKGYREKGE